MDEVFPSSRRLCMIHHCWDSETSTNIQMAKHGSHGLLLSTCDQMRQDKDSVVCQDSVSSGNSVVCPMFMC